MDTELSYWYPYMPMLIRILSLNYIALYTDWVTCSVQCCRHVTLYAEAY